MLRRRVLIASLVLFILIACGTTHDICHCVPTKPDSVDYRFAEKHIPLPDITPIQITVDTILSWPQDTDIPDGTPRTGRELQLFAIPQAFVQAIWLQPTDCDVHFEISQTPAKDAPRVIIETPRDDEYCDVRKHEQALGEMHGTEFSTTQEEVSPFSVSVLGMAFEDFEHDRGSPRVKTVWELHPAVVQ